MSAPSAPRLSVVAGLDVVVVAFRDEHDHLHAEFMAHWRRCHRACISGGLCPVGRRLADAADAAGYRWERADALARRAAVRP